MLSSGTIGRLSLVLALLFTSTAQAEWVKQFSLAGDGNGAYGVGAFDDTTAAAVGKSNSGQGDKGAAWWTANGGDMWTAGSITGTGGGIIPPFMFQLSFADTLTAYGVGLGMYQSKDGGKSWNALAVPGVGGFDQLMDVHAVNTNYIYAISGSKVIYTGNGGLNWSTTDLAIGQELQAIFFVDNLRGWAVGGRQEEITEEDPYSPGQEKVVGYDIKPEGIVMYSSDGGRTFEPRLINSPDIFRSIHMFDANVGLAAAGNNNKKYFIKRTTDGGKSWSDITLPTHPAGEWVFLTRALMLTPIHAIAAGSVGNPDGGYGNKAVVIESFDGGVTWEFVPEAEQQGGYFDIVFPCENAGWVVGDWGLIVKYSNGGGCAGSITNPDGNPEGGGEDIVSDVWTWGHMFGTFGDDKPVGENSAPGETDVWGGIIPGDEDTGGANCKEVKKSEGCSSTTHGRPAAALMLTGALLILVALRRARRTAFLALALVSLGTVACGSETTQTVCEEVAPAPEKDTSGTEEDSTIQPEEFRCLLLEGEQPANFTGSGQRKANSNNRIVFVRESETGGSDLYTMAPDGSDQRPLTRFEDPAVNVYYPTWSPERDYIAFASDYRLAFNEARYNIFVVSSDGSKCYQVTPDIDSKRIKTTADTLTVQGSFRFGQGAIAAPVANATVAVEGTMLTAQTGQGGEFTIEAPAGTGRLIFRGTANGLSVVATADYDGAKGDVVTLTGVVGKSEGTPEIGPIHWAPAGSNAIFFLKETLVRTYSAQMNTGEVTPVFDSDEDAVGALGFLPSGEELVASYKSAPQLVGVYSINRLDKTQKEFIWEGQTETSKIAVSPLYFLASLQGDKIVLLGADAEGEIATLDATPGNLSGLIPDQFDWSLDATHIVVTVQGAKGPNLASVNVNEKKLKVLTTDGRSKMPAWFGR